MNFDRVEKYRKPHPLGLLHKKGDDFGWFEIPTSAIGPKLRVICSPSTDDWQHVSVSLKFRAPIWDEMCKVKNLFWDEEALVIQFHPPKSEYINNAKYCLHLWARSAGDLLFPPSIYVGLKEFNYESQ